MSEYVKEDLPDRQERDSKLAAKILGESAPSAAEPHSVHECRWVECPIHSVGATERSEQQEWRTTERGLDIGSQVFAMSAPKADAIIHAHNAALSAETQWWSGALAEANEIMNRELDAERQRREQAERDARQSEILYLEEMRSREQTERQVDRLLKVNAERWQQLLSALAALKELQDERAKDKDLPKV